MKGLLTLLQKKKIALCNYTLSYWWQPISLKETPVHGEVGPTKYIMRAQWICRWPRGFAIMSFIRHQWRRCSRRSLGANPKAAKAPWTPLKWIPPAQAWFGILDVLIVPVVTNGLRRSHSQAWPKLITWLGASAFLANRASAFLSREITHNALWNGGGGVGWSIKFFPLLLRWGEPQFCQCGMSDVACFLLALPPEGKQR